MRTLTRLTAVTALILAAVLSVTVRPAAAADATGPNVPRSWVKPGQVEPPVIRVPRAKLQVIYAERVEGRRWLIAEFNDGRLVVFRACRAEDGRRCWWDSANRGNGIGAPWVRYAGRTHHLPVSMPREAGLLLPDPTR